LAGIYIHVPFCKKRCNYCDFYKTTNISFIDEFIKSLSEEINIRKQYLDNTGFDRSIETLYFGGGTPSVLSIQNFEKIIEQLYSTFTISERAEITVEVNPDDVDFEYIKALQQLGVNRLSMGVQSFSDKYLQLMNRRHTGKQALQSIETAIQAGISNLSIDLIYGLPEMTTAVWEQTLETALLLPVKHLSAYHLIYEEGTIFHDWLGEKKLREIDEDLSWEQFQMLHKMSISKGFEHYEISNLAKPGFYSGHNSNYWQGIPYFGAGPSAHSFNGHSRQWNIADLRQYMKQILSNQPAWQTEQLTPENKLNEYIMIRLRTKKGVDLNYMKQTFGKQKLDSFLHKFHGKIDSKNAKIEGNRAFLTLNGWFISDKIIGELIH
jgi:oxygen-independent coproporphyrinogen-3 oxidase